MRKPGIVPWSLALLLAASGATLAQGQQTGIGGPPVTVDVNVEVGTFALFRLDNPEQPPLQLVLDEPRDMVWMGAYKSANCAPYTLLTNGDVVLHVEEDLSIGAVDHITGANPEAMVWANEPGAPTGAAKGGSWIVGFEAWADCESTPPPGLTVPPPASWYVTSSPGGIPTTPGRHAIGTTWNFGPGRHTEGLQMRGTWRNVNIHGDEVDWWRLPATEALSGTIYVTVQAGP